MRRNERQKKSGNSGAFSLAACLLLCAVLGGILSGCGRTQQYQATYYDLFDTVTSVTGQARSEAAFLQQAQEIHDELLEYHQLFDIYQEYEGINNLKTVNDQAGKEPVAVDERIIRLLQDCLIFYDKTGGKVNIGMGSVLQLWHDCRTEAQEMPELAALPEESALELAALHMDPAAVLIDEKASSVFLTEEEMRLDVGAIAKGWAVQRAAEQAPEGFLISVGGNVCATGPKDSAGTPWKIGIQDPGDPEKILETLSLTKGAVVTSGDYQRTYEVNGKAYHHIIDPETLYPGTKWRSVTVVCPDSGAADALSTALFLMDRESGEALLDQYDAEAMWVDADGTAFYSEGF